MGALFVYGLTYGGALLALIRPFYGLLAYICLAVLRPDYLWAWSLPANENFSRTVGIALIIGWLLQHLVRWSQNHENPWDLGPAKSIVLLLAGYWLWMLVSALFADNQDVAWSYVSLHSKILLPVLAGMTLVTTAQQVRQLAWTLVACLGYLAYEAHGMYYGGRLIEFRDLGMLGMDNNSICIAMATGVGLAIFLGLSEPHLWQQLTAFLLATLMLHVPMFGLSRGGMLGAAVVGVVTFMLLPKRTNLLLVYAVGLLVAIRLAGPAVAKRFSTIFVESESRDASAQGRVELWADCWDVMLHHPLVGIGPDNWPLIAHHYGWPYGKEAHSLWFNCGAELGFVGLGLLASFYLCTIYLCWRELCRGPHVSYPSRSAGRMVIAALSGFMVSASFVALDALEVPFYTVLIGVGALRVAYWEREAEYQMAPLAPQPALASRRYPTVSVAPLISRGTAGIPASATATTVVK
ncbi:MAG: O-antigen ligase family protein [Planctomycetales bacterium]|nr:O-antigen ligase family protein [Planctomycetales bacterium]